MESSVELVWSMTGDPNPFNIPDGIAVDQQGNLYAMDSISIWKRTNPLFRDFFIFEYFFAALSTAAYGWLGWWLWTNPSAPQ